MNLIFKQTNFSINSSINKEGSLSFLKSELRGKNQFKVETAFGSSDVSYYGEFDEQQIYFRREMGISFRLAPYPDAMIGVEADGANSKIHIRISLSVYWKIILVFMYGFIFFGVIFNLIYRENHAFWPLLKGFSALVFIQLFTLVFHFSEKKNLKKILETLVRIQQRHNDSLQK